MSFYAKWRTPGALALAAGLLVSSGCAETALVGQLDDSELQDVQVLPLAALGISREINDLIFANIDYYEVGGYTDEIAYGGVSGYESRTAIGDVEGNFSSHNGIYQQIQEAVWASYKVVDLAYVLYDGGPSFQTSPLVARSWLAGGQMERVMADWFCDATYQYGPTGGFNVQNLEDWANENGFDLFALDAGKRWSKAEMYGRAAFAFERAAEQAERSLAAGDTTGQGEDGGNDTGYNWFDAERVRLAAYAGLAQVRLDMASYGMDPAANYAAAAAAAAEVPTDFVDWWNTDGTNLRENQNQNLSWDNDDISHWGDTINGVVWGSAFTHLVTDGDLRAAHIETGEGGIQKCQELAVKSGSEDGVFAGDGSNVVNTGNQGCADSSDRVSINRDMELDALPRWLLDNWSNEDRDIEAVEGTDARLVEAEVALVNGDFTTFYEKINEVREFHNAPPIPAGEQYQVAGDFEYPNALDDAWSYLDRELLLDGMGELRRFSQLDRFNHPFITENHTTHPEWRDLLAEQEAGYQRGSCLLIPSNECNLNNALECPTFN